MGGKTGGTIGTFLLSVPVAAILLMAVFGVPRLAPGTNGEGGWQDPRQFFANLSNAPAPQNELFADYQQGQAPQDAFGAQAAAADAPRWGGLAHNAQPSATPEAAPPEQTAGLDQWPLRSAAPAAEPAPPAAEQRPARQFLFPRNGGGQPGNVSETTATLTWKEARRRLSELGVKQFHLEPGFGGDEFLFVCLFSPGDDPSVTHRFEAEAAEPLAAVERVLTQIDGWLEQRYAAGTAASPLQRNASF